MAIRWDNIRPWSKRGHVLRFDLGVLMSAIHQIPVIHDKNDQAELRRYELANEFKTGENGNELPKM